MRKRPPRRSQSPPAERFCRRAGLVFLLQSEICKNDSFAPSVVGNIVFLIREHPIIVNLHKSADTNNPLESFNWLKNVTRDYRGLLLRINGLI